MIDWVSRLSYCNMECINPFLDKPVLLASATTGYSGGQIGLEHLATLMRYVGGLVLASSVSISHAHKIFDDADTTGIESVDGKIEPVLERFLHLVTRLHSLS